MNTIAEQWFSYATECIPATASERQRLELRRAFYAGAATFYGEIARIELAEVSELQGVKMIAALRLELEAFGQAVTEGRA